MPKKVIKELTKPDKKLSTKTYNVSKYDTEKRPDGTTIQTFNVSKTNKRFLTPTEVKALSEKLMNDKSVLDGVVRGLAIDKWNTLKGWGQDIRYLNEDEYYEGKVKDTAKFHKYFQLQIILIKKPSQNKKSKKN